MKNMKLLLLTIGIQISLLGQSCASEQQMIPALQLVTSAQNRSNIKAFLSSPDLLTPAHKPFIMNEFVILVRELEESTLKQKNSATLKTTRDLLSSPLSLRTFEKQYIKSEFELLEDELSEASVTNRAKIKKFLSSSTLLTPAHKPFIIREFAIIIGELEQKVWHSIDQKTLTSINNFLSSVLSLNSPQPLHAQQKQLIKGELESLEQKLPVTQEPLELQESEDLGE